MRCPELLAINERVSRRRLDSQRAGVQQNPRGVARAVENDNLFSIRISTSTSFCAVPAGPSDVNRRTNEGLRVIFWQNQAQTPRVRTVFMAEDSDKTTPMRYNCTTPYL